jgi:hypothetical protein
MTKLISLLYFRIYNRINNFSFIVYRTWSKCRYMWAKKYTNNMIRATCNATHEIDEQSQHKREVQKWSSQH